MEEVKTAGSFQQEMLGSAARAARGGACLRSGAWIDFAAEFILRWHLQNFLQGVGPLGPTTEAGRARGF